MSDPLLPSPGDENYKPLSGFALAGLFVGAGFAVVALLGAGVAVGFGSPIFFPIWFLLTPVVGFVLAFVGRNQIVGADATRAGLRAANWGMGLALFSGLGYAAYYFAVGMAVTAQANEFLVGEPDAERGFFKRLARGGEAPGELDLAFLLTRPAAGRIKLRPGDTETLRATYDQSGPDGGAGELSRFRSMALVRMLARAGDAATVKTLGVRDWAHEKSSYKVSRNYEIATPEATLELAVQTESAEGEAEGQLRQWFVNLARTQTNRKLTPLGQTIEAVRERAHRFVQGEFRGRLAGGKAFPDLVKADATDWTSIAPETAEQAKNRKRSPRGFYQAQLRSQLEGLAPLPYDVVSDPTSWPFWGLDGQGRLWMDVPIQFMVPGDRETLPAAAQGRIRVRTTAPLDPAQALPPRIDWDAEQFAVERLRAMRGPQ